MDWQFQLWHVKSLEFFTPFLQQEKAEQTETQWLFRTHERTEFAGQTTAPKSEETQIQSHSPNLPYPEQKPLEL